MISVVIAAAVVAVVGLLLCSFGPLFPLLFMVAVHIYAWLNLKLYYFRKEVFFIYFLRVVI